MARDVRPPVLGHGSTIAIVTLSYPGPAVWPHRLERGVNALRSMGFCTQIMPHATTRRGHTSGTPKERAKDLMDAFLDPGIDGIWCSMGGDHSNQILDHLDFQAIRTHPKVFVGYADNTVVHSAIGRDAGLVTFLGTAVLTGLGEFPDVLSFTRSESLRALTKTAPLGSLPSAREWTDESMKWHLKEDLSRPRKTRPGEGLETWKEGEGTGPIEGGCIASLMHLAGTRWWPDLRDAVLLLETSEHGYPPSKADAHLTDLDHLGVLDCISALLVARAARYTDQEKEDFKQVVLERTAGRTFPIVANLDAGHADPMLTIPLGCRTLVRASSGGASVEVLEPGVVGPALAR